MKRINGFNCAHCGQSRGKHQASGEYCPVADPSQPSRLGFHRSERYSPDESNPTYQNGRFPKEDQ